MCAISGTTKNDRALIEHLNLMQKHRGPDGSAVYQGDGITLGHNRLAVIDLSNRAAQPMKSADGRFVITYNGEIYNYRELRAELSDYPFKSESDTEVLLAAYTKWGEAMLPKLRGIFAFGIWDEREKSLLLARDQMGVKPLYYSLENGVISFASELGSFTRDHRSLDRQSVALYLALEYVPSPHTMLRGVSKLPPGHFLAYQNGQARVNQYWNPFTGDGDRVESGGLYDTIDSAVKRQLISDRPVGVFLSGGLDSSIVLHHMNRHAESVRSFSVDFEMVRGEEAATERFNTDAALAKRTAQAYGALHKTFTISLGDVRKNLITVCEALDEPVANPTGLSQYLLSKWVREDGVVVALGGDGGDELFGGYTRHRAMMAAYYYQQLPNWLQKLGARLNRKADKLSVPVGVPLHIALMAVSSSDVDRMTKDELGTTTAATAYLTALYNQAPPNLHPLDVFMRADRFTWLPEESLARSDRSSMAHGLELRVPLLDLDVVKLADRISVYRKTNPWQGKNILRQAYKQHLPAHLFRQPKRGWISPAAKWMRDEEIKAQLHEVFSRSYYDGLSPLFDWNAVGGMLEEHVERRAYNLYPLWQALMLQVWAKRHGLLY